MTDFQLGLLVLGALAIGAVVLYNRLQERGARRLARSFGDPNRADPLAETAPERREPTYEAWSRPRRDGETDEPPAAPDPRLDYVVELAAAQPIAAAPLLDALARRFAGRARFALADGEDAPWRAAAPAEAAQCLRLRAGLQLVTRSGIVGESELIEFRSQLETAAARAGATVAAPEMKLALETARELDTLCAQTDIQVALHVVPQEGSAIDPDRFASAAADFGLAPEGAGASRYAHRDAEGRVLYRASPAGNTHAADDAAGALTLVMDVPRAPNTRRSYEAMVRCARHLADALGGDVKDDNGRVLGERELAAIETELDRVARQLEERGIVPGEALALRLFS